jgi:hypothetical protein
MKTFVYYFIAFLIAVTIGYFRSENPFYGFIIAMIAFAILSGILSLFLGIFNANPIEKSPYERRKKEIKE